MLWPDGLVQLTKPTSQHSATEIFSYSSNRLLLTLELTLGFKLSR